MSEKRSSKRKTDETTVAAAAAAGNTAALAPAPEPKEKRPSVPPSAKKDEEEEIIGNDDEDPCRGGNRSSQRPRTTNATTVPDWEEYRKMEERRTQAFEAMSANMTERMGNVEDALGGFKTVMMTTMAVTVAKEQTCTDTALGAVAAVASVVKLCSAHMRNSTDMGKVMDSLRGWAVATDQGKLGGYNEFLNTVLSVTPPMVGKSAADILEKIVTKARSTGTCSLCGRGNHSVDTCRARYRLDTHTSNTTLPPLSSRNATSSSSTQQQQQPAAQPAAWQQQPIYQIQQPQPYYQQQTPPVVQPTQQQGRGMGRGRGNGVICYRCHQPGHVSQFCNNPLPNVAAPTATQ